MGILIYSHYLDVDHHITRLERGQIDTPRRERTGILKKLPGNS